MATSSFGLLFLLSLLTTGVSDLLDVVPTDEYWRAKNVQVTEAAIAGELAPPPAAGDITKLLDALGDDQPAVRDAAAAKIRAMGPAVVPQLREAAKSGNPEVAARARQLSADVRTVGKAAGVRRLMAIRTAGEQKMRGLLPRLAELAKSDEMFVGDYAAAAVAAIEGKPYDRPHAAAGDDAWLLPADTRAVLHVGTAGRAKPVTAADLAETMKMVSGAGPGGNDEQAKQQVRQAMEQVIAVAEQTGNVRLDGLTVGVTGDVGNRAGRLVLIVRGRFDAKACADAAAAALPKDGNARQAVAGVDAIRLQREFFALFPSDTRAAFVTFVGGPPAAATQLEEVATALKSGQGPLRAVPEMAKLVGQADAALPLWGALHVNDNFRQAPPLRALDWVTLAGRAEGEATEFRFDAKGQNGPAVAELVEMVNGGLGQARAMLKQAVDAGGFPPGLKKFADLGTRLLASMKCATDEADPTRATLTGRIDAPPTVLLLGVFGVGVPRAAAGPAAPPAQPPQP